MPPGLEGDFGRDGYVIARGLFAPHQVRRLRATVDAAVDAWRTRDPETGRPGQRGMFQFFHPNRPEYCPQGSDGLAALLEAAADPGLLRVYDIVAGGDPLFSHLSVWFDPLRDSPGGGWHRDAQYTFPDESVEKREVLRSAHARKKRMGFQLQLALVPSRHVEYVPGSHLRWDTPEEYAVRKGETAGAARRWEPLAGAAVVDLAPGDAFAFNPYGIHRGHYRAGQQRRTVMVTICERPHGLDYFTFQPWMLEAGYFDGLTAPARAFYGKFLQKYGGEIAEMQRRLGALGLTPDGLRRAGLDAAVTVRQVVERLERTRAVAPRHGKL